MRHYLGIDIGTSACKAVAFDEEGKPRVEAFREYNVLSSEAGAAELNSEEVMEKTLSVIHEAAVGAGKGTVQGLGISSQGEATTAVGRDGKGLCHAMVSSDVRASTIAGEWPQEFGEERLYRITGHTAHPMFTVFKLLWLRKHRPEIWKQTDRFYCFEDLLQFRLGLDPAMGWPLAGRTMMFDVTRHEWSDEILDAVGLSPNQLARPLPSGSIVGRIPPSVARSLELAETAFVVTGGHDQPCGALGAGATEPGVAMYATGTVECITPAFSEAVFDEELRKGNLCTYDHTVPGMYTTVAFSLTGGNILKWFRDEFGAIEEAEARAKGISPYEMLLESAAREPTGLLVLPYFTPSGTPYFDLDTPGAIVGLRLSTSRGEFLRALLEGVAFEMRLNMDILERVGCRIREFRAIGGGARSAFWTQLKADVAGKPIIPLAVTEAGCLGVAMLACAADRDVPLTDVARQWVKTGPPCHPDPRNAEWYDRQFLRYSELYPAMRDLGAGGQKRSGDVDH